MVYTFLLYGIVAISIVLIISKTGSVVIYTSLCAGLHARVVALIQEAENR